MRKALVAAILLGALGAVALVTHPDGGGDPGRGSLLEQDSAAQSHARQLASNIESCFETTHEYTRCTPAEPTLDLADLETTGSERVTVTDTHGTDSYSLTARSRSGNVFTITKTTTGTTRTCSWAEGTRGGGCTGPAW
jgi:hypothetical protein